jgi:hypothetical protein
MSRRCKILRATCPKLAEWLKMTCIGNPSPFPVMPDIVNLNSLPLCHARHSSSGIYPQRRHSRHVLSGISLGFLSDGSPLTTCGDDRRERSFPTFVIGNPSYFFGSLLTLCGNDETKRTLKALPCHFVYCFTFSTVFSLITSISRMMLTSSPTSIPPLSNNLLNFMPKSFRFSVPEAVKPARVLPQGS